VVGVGLKGTRWREVRVRDACGEGWGEGHPAVVLHAADTTNWFKDS